MITDAKRKFYTLQTEEQGTDEEVNNYFTKLFSSGIVQAIEEWTQFLMKDMNEFMERYDARLKS